MVLSVMILWILSLNTDIYIRYNKIYIIKEINYYEPNNIRALNKYITINFNNEIQNILSKLTHSNKINKTSFVSFTDVEEFMFSVPFNIKSGLNKICLKIYDNDININNVNKIREIKNNINKALDKENNINKEDKQKILNRLDNQIDKINLNIRNEFELLIKKYIDYDIYRGECNKYIELINKLNSNNNKDIIEVKESIKDISHKIDKVYKGLTITFYTILGLILLSFIILLLFTKKIGNISILIYRLLIIIIFIMSGIIFFGIIYISGIFIKDNKELYSKLFNNNDILRSKYWGLSTIYSLISLIIISLALIQIIFIKKSKLI